MRFKCQEFFEFLNLLFHSGLFSVSRMVPDRVIALCLPGQEMKSLNLPVHRFHIMTYKQKILLYYQKNPLYGCFLLMI